MAEAAPKTVNDDMPNRRVFPSVEKASEYLNASAQTYVDFAKIPLAAPGLDEEGNFDPTIYTDSMDVMVALLKADRKLKCIVIAPIPKIPTLIGATEEDYGKIPAAQRDWVEKILHKELNHVAVRPLRDAEDVTTMVDQMPTTLEAYTAGREGGAGILEAFNELYKSVNSTMSSKSPVWAKARLIKSELRKALESRGYALEYYAAIEDRGEDKESLFVLALRLFILASEKKGLDPAIFERWLSTRNAKTFTAGTEEDEDDFDVDAMLSDMESKEAEDSKPAATEDEAATAGTTE